MSSPWKAIARITGIGLLCSGAAGLGTAFAASQLRAAPVVIVRHVPGPVRTRTKVLIRTRWRTPVNVRGYVACIEALAWGINVYPVQNQGYAPQAIGSWDGLDAGPVQCEGLGLPPPPH